MAYNSNQNKHSLKHMSTNYRYNYHYKTI